MTDRISDARLAELMTLVTPDFTYTRLRRAEHDEIYEALRELKERRKGNDALLTTIARVLDGLEIVGRQFKEHYSLACIKEAREAIAAARKETP